MAIPGQTESSNISIPQQDARPLSVPSKALKQVRNKKHNKEKVELNRVEFIETCSKKQKARFSSHDDP
jgi:hypothetical protein